jgi:transcriptional regulator with XRE-family HTH domain
MGRPRPSHISDPISFGAKIRQLRDERGLSLRDIAFDGCSPSYLSRVEAGQRVPSMPILIRLAAALGTNVETLLGRKVDGCIAEGDLVQCELAARLDGKAARRQIDQVLAAAAEIGDKASESRLLELLGMIALDERNDDRAIGLLEQAREATNPRPRERSSLFRELGRAYAAIGDYGRSIAVLSDAFEDAESEPADPSLAAQFGNYLANAYTDQGSFAQAETVLARMLRHEPLLNEPSLLRLEWSLARTYGEQGRAVLAETYARRAMARLRSSEERRTLGNAHLLLAGTLISQQRFEEAEIHLDQAARRLDGEPGPDLAWLTLERARLALAQGRIDEADFQARRALEQTASTEPTHAAAAYSILAEVALFRGELDDGRQLANDALAGFADGMPLQRGRALDVLSRIEEQAGNLEAALAAARARNELVPR